jgi:hypothetical protein
VLAQSPDDLNFPHTQHAQHSEVEVWKKNALFLVYDLIKLQKTFINLLPFLIRVARGRFRPH